MHIALDGSDLAANRFEGPSVYAGELLPRLSKSLRDRGHTVTTYLPNNPRGVELAGDVRVIPGSPFWTQRFFTAALRQNRPDVLFMPIQMLPLWRSRSMKTVAVVHDLEFLHYPQTYTFGNRMLLQWFTRHAVRNATQLITVSQYTKNDVVRTYRRAADDITVVHHGVQLGDAATDLKQYELPKRYILFVGALQPRKNIEGLMTAFEEVQKTERDLHLVIVGGGGWKSDTILHRIETSSVRRNIHILRRVPREDLVALYTHAEVFVLPSFSEGFGMPVLEAMAAGTPVITSNTSSLPEVAGDAALLVNPSNTSDIARALLCVLRESAVREDLTQKGRARAAAFTWDRTAEQTATVIERAGI